LVAAASAAVLAASGGCSTVILSEDSRHAAVAAVEREALASAAAAVAETPWPREPQASLADRLTGVSALPSSDANLAERFVDSLAEPRKPVVLAAAFANIEAARRLSETGESALTAIRPAMSDVAVVEAAIADLKKNRDIYVASLKLIARAGEPVESEELRRLRAGFSDAIGDLGRVADALAERMDDDATRTFASPAAAKFVN
jgi:hypothetical protein